MIVAEAAGEVVGLVSAQVGHALEFDGVYARITAMVVDTRWRGRGLGRSLMRQMEEWCRQRNAQSVILTSGHHRPDAHRFYQAIGYNATGLRFTKRL
jgi:GNAT superfamily N-acetyltransferase